MPNTPSTPPAAVSNTAPTHTGVEPRLVTAVSADGAAPQFKIPFSAQAIQSVESVDLDLVLTTTAGEKIILQQGALQAATAPDSKIVFQNGDSITAADQIKKLGVLKPVEGGSFRLKSGDASPAVAELVTGDGFGLGKELQDTMSQLTETSKQLEKVLQTLSTATLSNTADDSKPITAGPGTGTGVQKITPQSENKFASPSPGSPPQPEVEKFTSNNTSNNTDSGNVSSIKITSTLRGLYGAPDAIINHVRAVDKIQSEEQGKEVLKAFSQASLREMLPSDPLQVRVSGSTPVALEPNGLAHNTLVMPGVLNASSIRFELPQDTVLPAGFQIAGQTFSGSSITIGAESLKDLSLAIQWKVADLGASITKTDFQLGVKYLDNKGAELEQGRAPLTFTYGELKSIEDTVQLDGNSNTKIFLSAYGYSYEILGDEQGNHIMSGSGHDTLNGGFGADILVGGAGNDLMIGGQGADTLEGGVGNDTASYANSSDDLSVSLVDDAINSGGDAKGDKLSNIENLIGSDNNDTLTGNATDNKLEGGKGNDTLIGGAAKDTLDGGDGSDTASYASSAAVNVSLMFGAVNTGGDAVGDVLTHIENLIGSSGDDTLTGNDDANRIDGADGNDRLIGGKGADSLIGGDGSDTVDYSGSATPIAINVGQGAGLGGDASEDELHNIEKLIGSISDNDTLNFVGASSDVIADLDKGTSNQKLNGSSTNLSFSGFENLIGSDNNDTLTGNAIDNKIEGGNGNDTLIGGAGKDTLDGGDGSDTASYASSAAVNVSLMFGAANTGGDAVGDVLTHIENLIGSSGDDTLTGNDDTNRIDGADGNDRLIGGKGADSLIGGDGSDTVDYSGSATPIAINVGQGTGLGGDAAEDELHNIEKLIGSIANNDSLNFVGASSDVIADLDKGTSNQKLNGSSTNLSFSGFENLIGSDNNDKLTGNAVDNKLEGGKGNDTLIGGAGKDTLDGGDGSDTASYAGSTAVNVSLVFGVANTDGDAAGDVLSNIENLIGSDNNDKLTGNSVDNKLEGGKGNDTLIGGAGKDTLDGGDGSDTASYAGSTAVNVSLVSGAANTDGDAAGDVLSNIENLIGSDNNDKLTGNSVDNKLEGGKGNDTLIGCAGKDTLDGGDGSDTASYAGSAAVNVSLVSGAANTDGDAAGDVLSNIENLIGSDNNDKLTGNSVDNKLEGGKGNDTLIGGAGKDTLDGGDGSDTASYAGSTAVNVSLVFGVANTDGDAAGDVLSNIENLIGSDNNDTLTGNAVDNKLEGGKGNDTLIGGAGKDTLDGGDGSDTASYGGSAAVNVSLVFGAANTDGDAAGDVLTTIENLIGSDYNDTLTGNEQANRLEGAGGGDALNGGANNDTLIGGDGNDQLSGDEGDDLIFGGTGADTFNGGDGNDTASYEGSKGGVTVNLTSGMGSGFDADGDKLSNIENLIGSSAYGDRMTGNSEANSINGWGGDDFLDGGGGNDTLIGGTGHDTYMIYNTGVSIKEKAGEGTDTVISSFDYTLGENLENLILSPGNAILNGTGNTENNTITGNDGANTLSGDDGLDILIGGAGNDSLTGDAGNDSLTGNNGNDTLLGGAGDDILDLRTDNTTLVGDRAEGGEGNDTVIINQSDLGDSGINLDGGTDTDTLRVYGSANGQLDLKALNAVNFEKLDLRTDAVGTTVLLSSDGIMKMVNKFNDVDVLTLQLGSGDFYEIKEEAGVVVKTGQNLINFYSNSVSPQNLIVQVNFENV